MQRVAKGCSGVHRAVWLARLPVGPRFVSDAVVLLLHWIRYAGLHRNAEAPAHPFRVPGMSARRAGHAGAPNYY